MHSRHQIAAIFRCSGRKLARTSCAALLSQTGRLTRPVREHVRFLRVAKTRRGLGEWHGPKTGKARRARAGRASGSGRGLLQHVVEFGRQDVAAFDSASPDAVHVRAASRIVSPFEPPDPVAQVALRDRPPFRDRDHNRDRLVVALLPFGQRQGTSMPLAALAQL
jgi:hypothetical protein